MSTATNADEFLDKLLHVDSTIIYGIFEELKKRGFYRGGHWKGMYKGSAKRANETVLYGRFVKIATAVTSMVPSPQVQGKWVNCSDIAPKSKEPSGDVTRPDVGFVSKETNPDLLKRYNQRLNELREKIIMTKAENREEQSLHQIWWQQMLGPGVFKVDDNVLDALQQLCIYTKQVFHKQLDRRFIIGFTLCLDQLNIYLFDRSGVIGTEESIKIDKDPKKFIQFLVCYSTLSAERLGWDPTMQLYNPESGKPLPSYTFPWSKVFKDNEGKESLYDSQWVITLRDGSRWITIRALSIVGAEIMCGRATAVWEVVKFEEFERKTATKVLVLKQSWQCLQGQVHDIDLDEKPFEFFAYEKAKLGSRLKAAEYVLSPTAVPITTFNFIRNGLKGAGITPVATQPVSRTQTRILMDTRGWPLKFFQDLIELLRAIFGAVEDHRKLYLKEVLHRDISRGNIVILISGENGEEVGRLIDLDHAKLDNDGVFIDPLENELEFLEEDVQSYVTQSYRFKMFVSPEMFRAACVAFAKRQEDRQRRKGLSPGVNDIKAEAAFWAFNDAQNYIRDFLHVFSPKTSAAQPLLPEDVWPKKVPKQPGFGDHAAGLGHRTGTLPYMSHAILHPLDAPHDAIHDIESFFWIIIDIALNKEGPGGHTRVIKDNPALKNIIRRYVDGPRCDLAFWRGKLFSFKFEPSESVLDTIVTEFAPYFIPLKPFVKQLWKLLWMAFKHRAYELWCIHDLTLSLLKKIIKDLEQYSYSDASSEEREQWTKMENGEKARRKKYVDETAAVIQNHTFAERAAHSSTD